MLPQWQSQFYTKTAITYRIHTLSQKNYTEYYCNKCYSTFLNMKFDKKQNVCADPKKLIKTSQTFNQQKGTFANALCDLIKNFKYCKKMWIRFKMTRIQLKRISL
jgi:hypothetical protein